MNKNNPFVKKMKNQLIKSSLFIFILLACLCVNKSFAQTDSEPPPSETPFVNMLPDKHYVKPGSIVFAEKGLFLLIRGHLISINCVEADQDGVFIRPEAYKFGTCLTCNYPMLPWRTCTNVKCPTQLIPYEE